MRTIHIIAKCSDCCSTTFVNSETQDFAEMNGYVPRNIGIGGGDYIKLTIDIDTGTIKDWRNLTDEEIKDAIIDSQG